METLVPRVSFVVSFMDKELILLWDKIVEQVGFIFPFSEKDIFI